MSKAHHNRMVGQQSTFDHLEASVLSNLDKVNSRDATHLMYAYGIRNYGSEALHTAFMDYLKKEMRNLDYPALANAANYLMFRSCTDEHIWYELVDHTSRISELMPIAYLKPFKSAY